MATATKKAPDNMKIYEGHREPPKEAIKPIGAGRLKGMSDINPMWRLKALTEEFGPCGIGWYYTVDKQWLEPCGNETVAFVNISLFIKVDGEWSKPIFGTGGSKIIAMERSGAYVSDEAYKMATTDAISVACKQLGFAADVYWNSDRTKYSNNTTDKQDAPKENFKGMNPPEPSDEEKNAEMAASVDQNLIPQPNALITPEQLAKLQSEMARTGVALQQVLSIAQVDDIAKMSQSTAVAILNKFSKTSSKAG